MIQTEVSNWRSVDPFWNIQIGGYVYTDMQKTKRTSVAFGVCEFVYGRERDIRYTFSFDAEFVNTKMLKRVAFGGNVFDHG